MSNMIVDDAVLITENDTPENVASALTKYFDHDSVKRIIEKLTELNNY